MIHSLKKKPMFKKPIIFTALIPLLVASCGGGSSDDDTTPPSSATGLNITEESGRIMLTWQQANQNEVFGYRIIRDSITDYATATNTTYTDSNIMQGNVYCYQIVSFDEAGNEAAPSAQECFTFGEVGSSSVSFSSQTFTVDELAGSATITVRRSGELSEAISVDYSATGDSATEGQDFTAVSGTLNWATNEGGEKSFNVQILPDLESESNETVTLALATPSMNTTLGNINTATLTIENAQVNCIELTPTEIETNTTLDQPCYNVNDSIDISNNATLTISPGVTLRFASGSSLDVEDDGILIASGTADAPIIFTGQIQAPGFWSGIEINSIATSVLNHTIVEYGGSDSSFNPANVGLSFDGRASIDNSIIRYSATRGVALSNGEVLTAFSNNTVTLNEGAPVSIHADAVFVLDSSNSFTGNRTATNQSQDYIFINSADIDTNQTWQANDVRYRTSGIDVDAELTLSPGVEIEFLVDGSMDVSSSGTLIAEGTQAQPILITGVQATPGYWNGIQFTFNNTNNIMEHTIVEYGGGGGNTLANVGVFGSDGRLTIRNSTFRFSSDFGLDLDDGIDLTMENIVMEGNNVPIRIAGNDLSLIDPNSNYSGNTDDRIHVASDTFNRAQTIVNPSVPYYFIATTQQGVDDALTINQGVEIQFNSGGGFSISRTGSLAITGNIDNPVLLTGAIKEKGYWKGIQYTFSDSPSNNIDFAILEYGGSTGGNTEALVGYFGSGSNASQGNVTNSVLRFSSTNGIHIDEDTMGDFTTGNTFEDIDGQNIFTD